MYRVELVSHSGENDERRLQQQSGRLSYNVHGRQKAIYRLRQQTDSERAQFIINTFTTFFRDGIAEDPKAFRGRFRKMATTPFKFYRGSATLFYQDLKEDQDPYIARNEAAGLMFIHGDLHAENFGTYLDNRGVINFDVNDFDEAYVGPFTWDVKRLLASLNIIFHAKGFSDNEIQQILATCVRAYLKTVYSFCDSPNRNFALTSKTTEGRIKQLINETRLKSHVEHLNECTTIENYDRIFKRSDQIKDVDARKREDIVRAFQQYLETIPESKRDFKTNLQPSQQPLLIKDIVSRSSPGIGSAGKTSYNILLEGKTQALEDDVVLFMKPAQKSAISYVVRGPEIDRYFLNDGLRTVLCSYAMQAATPKWLGFTSLNGVACVVDEYTPHAEDLDWGEINDFNEICQVVDYLGRATAKIHCVADADCINTPKSVPSLPFSIIPRNTEVMIRNAIDRRDEEFIHDMIEFGMVYGEQVRRDHHLFFEAFRNKMIAGL